MKEDKQKAPIRKTEIACLDGMVVNISDSNEYFACIKRVRLEISRYCESQKIGKIFIKDSETKEEIETANLSDVMAFRNRNGKALDITIMGDYSESERMANLLYSAFAIGGPRLKDIAPYCKVAPREED